MQDWCDDHTQKIELSDQRYELADGSTHGIDDCHQNTAGNDVSEQTQRQRRKGRDLTDDIDDDERCHWFKQTVNVVLYAIEFDGIFFNKNTCNQGQCQSDTVV